MSSQIENRIRLIELTTITFPADRQRSQIDPKTLLPLALNIAEHGLIQPIGLKEESLELLFGGRRYHASLLCCAVHSQQDHPLVSNYTDDELATLRLALETHPQYDNWSKLPARLVRGTSALSSAALEFLENACREELNWQEKAAACTSIHLQAAQDARARGQVWTDADTARILGISKPDLSILLAPQRKAENIRDPEVKARAIAAIKESPTARSAANAIETIATRHGTSTQSVLKGLKLTAPAPVNPIAATVVAPAAAAPSASLGERSIICANFHEWASAYNDEPFNFIHCDLPYGINFNDSEGQRTSAATRQVGDYDDSEEVYWALLDILLASRKHLIADSAHIMFWFSQKFRRETEDRIMAAWPDANISKFLLIWHMENNSGLLPTPAEGRRTYETAMQITLGSRPLAKQKAMSFSAPRAGKKIHRSEKPAAILTHFMSMYVDSSSLVLDPTCGSGSSILTAHKLGAKRIQGIEIDPEMHKMAVKYFNESLKC